MSSVSGGTMIITNSILRSMDFGGVSCCGTSVVKILFNWLSINSRSSSSRTYRGDVNGLLKAYIRYI